MRLKKAKTEQNKTEVELFGEKFPRSNKKNSYRIEYNALGEILGIESENPKIIAYAKKIGLIESD